MHDLDAEAVQAALDYYEANPDVVCEVETWREATRRRSLDEGATTLDEIRQSTTTSRVRLRLPSDETSRRRSRVTKLETPTRPP